MLFVVVCVLFEMWWLSLFMGLLFGVCGLWLCVNGVLCVVGLLFVCLSLVVCGGVLCLLC